LEEAAAAASKQTTTAAQAEQGRSSLEIELEAARRDVTKAEVACKSLEREVGRLKAAAADTDRVKFEYLEGKLRSKEEMVATLRKERNALLAALRREQQWVAHPGQGTALPNLHTGGHAIAEGGEGSSGRQAERSDIPPPSGTPVDEGEAGSICHKVEVPRTHPSSHDGSHRRRLVSPSKLEELRALSNNLLAGV
jgi:hypothetical protein